ncbi:MAG: carbamoyl phosphate synthase small subunit [Candidatus Omnitrophica bacterium 4484_70.2]|nr:MAG: carbamoyl phosphate synthase small subunit [Candidatus Omnitrophica bacterium 4484_70.2]
MTKALLLLEDGFLLEGESLGREGETIGEVVFNTSMTGYQEILTDPSYKGQIVCMTYPLIGNYGVNKEDVESCKIWAEGFIIKEESNIFSNWRATQSLDEYLKEEGVVGIKNVDTRALVRHIRIKGSMKGIISSIDYNPESLRKKLDSFPSIVGQDLVQYVSCKEFYEYRDEYFSRDKEWFRPYKIVVVDCGVKQSILRNLKRFFEKVIVVPATFSYKEILEFSPDAILFSNGPGDPQPLSYLIENCKIFIEQIKSKNLKIALFGICLGHQIIGLSLGGRAQKLKFGHHGGNHPVKDLLTGKIYITSQNHNFIIPPQSIPDNRLLQTHVNLYDNTPEGSRLKDLPIFSVQFHPEAGPGPYEGEYIFREFIKITQEVKRYA